MGDTLRPYFLWALAGGLIKEGAGGARAFLLVKCAGSGIRPKNQPPPIQSTSTRPYRAGCNRATVHLRTMYLPWTVLHVFSFAARRPVVWGDSPAGTFIPSPVEGLYPGSLLVQRSGDAACSLRFPCLSPC